MDGSKVERNKLIEQLEVCSNAILTVTTANAELEEAKVKHESLVNRSKKPYTFNWTASTLVTLIFGTIQVFIMVRFGWLENETVAAFLTLFAYGWVAAACFSTGSTAKTIYNAATQNILEEEIPAIEAKISDIDEELTRICSLEDVQFMTEFLPADYASYDAVNYFIDVLKNQRADTLKEAINLYEDNKHKAEMLAMQELNTSLLKEQAALQKEQFAKQEQWQMDHNRQQERLVKTSAKVSKQVRFGNAVGVINTVRHWKK